MKLTKFQKIGIFVSVLWVLEAAYSARYEQLQYAENQRNEIQQLCIAAQKHTALKCLELRNVSIETTSKPNWLTITQAALLPLLTFWVMVFLGLRLSRWLKDKK